jgi:hypothetical protein
MKKAITTFYSALATFLILEFLLTLWSVVFHNSFFTNELLFTRDNVVVRGLILVVCSLSLGQIYLLHIKGKKLTPARYWMLLGLNSACTVYLKYSNDFIPSNYLKVNTVLFSISFVTWTLLLVLGVLYKSILETYLTEETIAVS